MQIKLTDVRTEMAFIANKTALFAVFRASSRVTTSFSSSMSVLISAYFRKTRFTSHQGELAPISSEKGKGVGKITNDSG